MSKSKQFLQQNLFEEGLKYFGHKNKNLSIEIANIWHDDRKYYQRWQEIENYGDNQGKILDMACGVGTFMFHGLRKGYDIYGIEPEEWKLSYIDMKIDEMNYPKEWKNRFIQGFGENLPFEDEYFDFIVTYQTLEHVQNVEKCLDEMIRVLKHDGKIKIQCPDYNSFYEPHYQLPFLPKMNRKLASVYLKILKKPTIGLDSLNWTTNESIIKILKKYKNLEIISLSKIYKNRKINNLKDKYKLPIFISKILVNLLYYRKVYLGKEEKHINIIVKKRDM
ncbi:class I SAM-dependent methyltransferase [Aliarcobacter skirrowii]|uniref:class I SAM-dependent methyltransferase n=1 Tax=Aliarcobacter skirrowii TaxID=28200 RepID=UPI0029A1731E|nr:class I SAM-dependent methyltransferase [Aliarcobacter skirrowii]MDX4063328.1 class I SAM-dependent methyltransferase [Aliarcobacter skirrowii]